MTWDADHLYEAYTRDLPELGEIATDNRYLTLLARQELVEVRLKGKHAQQRVSLAIAIRNEGDARTQAELA